MFETVYYWFSGLYGAPLFNFLRGIDCTEAQSLANYFPTIGLITLGISTLIAVLFYFVINHPHFNKWWSWLIMMAFSGVISLAVGFFYVKSMDAEIPVYYRYSQTTQNEEITAQVEVKYEVSASNGNVDESIEGSIETSISSDNCNGLTAVPGTEQIFTSTYTQFGVANMIVSCIFFMLVSLLLNWFSTNCKHSPFKF